MVGKPTSYFFLLHFMTFLEQVHREPFRLAKTKFGKIYGKVVVHSYATKLLPKHGKAIFGAKFGSNFGFAISATSSRPINFH